MASDSARPLLLPQNRKVRHLQGVYLRNLSLTRPRGQTIDDASLNKSAQKLEALREPQLHHSHSSGELRPPKLRRRSTNWSGATPDSRQKKLEDVMDSRTADTFFSLHCEGQDDPIYISEVVEKAMNPTYRFFDLSTSGPAVTRLDTITVKIWVKKNDYMPLLEEKIDLRSLNFVGSLQNRSFPPNCILFHLVDGIYSIDVPPKPPKLKSGVPVPSSSYNALMRLSNLDESIQDALATRRDIEAQINALLQSNHVDKAPQAQRKAALAKHYVASEHKMLKASIRRRAELKASIDARREAIKTGGNIQKQAMEDINNAKDKLSNCETILSTAQKDIHGQRRRICEELLNIFHIEPTSTPLLFKICGLPLANSSFDDADEDIVSGALGYVARLVDILQYYLAVNLPYPVTPFGSRSIIQDNISSTISNNQRTFPLYNKGTVQFRFDYGVFLLNKNIECLAESQGLKVIDIRQTLPNLKYLLYVCSAGNSELPTRKAGGIRGLVTGREPEISSRRGSADSGVIGMRADALRKAVENGGAPPGLMRAMTSSSSSSSSISGGALPFGDDDVKSLRTSGLRENVWSSRKQ